MTHTFTGSVNFRSSIGNTNGVPGETAIHVLNPQRESGILKATGWDRLEPGSLNLNVTPGVVDALGERIPLWVEDGKDVVYPDACRHIPLIREAYWYYSATVSGSGKSRDVLVRRAKNPLPGRVELFAPIKLRDYFGLAAGDKLQVEVHAP